MHSHTLDNTSVWCEIVFRFVFPRGFSYESNVYKNIFYGSFNIEDLEVIISITLRDWITPSYSFLDIQIYEPVGIYFALQGLLLNYVVRTINIWHILCFMKWKARQKPPNQNKTKIAKVKTWPKQWQVISLFVWSDWKFRSILTFFSLTTDVIIVCTTAYLESGTCWLSCNNTFRSLKLKKRSMKFDLCWS